MKKKYKDTTYGGVIKRPIRPVSDYPFDKKIYKYILQKKHVDIIITQELHKLHMLNANKMHINKLKGYYVCSNILCFYLCDFFHTHLDIYGHVWV